MTPNQETPNTAPKPGAIIPAHVAATPPSVAAAPPVAPTSPASVSTVPGLIGQVSEEQIQAWKQEHGEVFAFKTGGHIGYVRRPSRTELSYFMVIPNPLTSNETYLRSCWLGGSMEIQTNDRLFLGAQRHLTVLTGVAEAELVKL